MIRKHKFLIIKKGAEWSTKGKFSFQEILVELGDGICIHIGLVTGTVYLADIR